MEHNDRYKDETAAKLGMTVERFKKQREKTTLHNVYMAVEDTLLQMFGPLPSKWIP